MLFNVEFKVWIVTVSEDSDIDVGIWGRYGSLDDLDVSIDGVDIPLFLNSLGIFCRKHIRFVELVTAINKRPAWTPKIT